MPLPQKRLYTIEDIRTIPGGTRVELIDGQIYYMTPPTRRHQRIAVTLYRKIAEYINKKGGVDEVDIAPLSGFGENNINYVEPDISVVCEQNKFGAPDWIIEIVSPGSWKMDYFIKLFKYRTAGVREYWIVNPEKNRITVYNFESEDVGEYSFEDAVQAGIYRDLVIDFREINI